jgi:hypothetical protein
LHDRIYFGKWREASGTDDDLEEVWRQLQEYVRLLEAEVGTYLEKAHGAYLRADARLYPDAATLNLDTTLSCAHHALNNLLRSQGTPGHDPMTFESFYDIVEVPFREII